MYPRAKPTAVWASTALTAIRVVVSIGGKQYGCSLVANVSRRRLPKGTDRALSMREHDICKWIAVRSSEVLRDCRPDSSAASLRAIQAAFDEYVVAAHLQGRHKLTLQIAHVFEHFRELAQQKIENRTPTFGCILDPSIEHKEGQALFPREFREIKKFKALSDGFRTAYHISKEGGLHNLVDLDRFEDRDLRGKHFYPDWAEPIARASRDGRCGIALSQQGDILVFDEGTLRFTFRLGQWQYWNHPNLVKLLHDRAAAQRVSSNILGRVVGTIYRAALDVSFRRSGGLFVILHNRKSLRRIVRQGDAIGDSRRGAADQQFDPILANHPIWSLARSVVVELASLDGAVVLDNSGRIKACGAVLSPKRAGRLRAVEGSRTKVAIGASHYGLALKVSSDGDITVYYKGREFIEV